MKSQPCSKPRFNPRLSSPWTLSAALAATVLVLYWPATGFEFSHHDDLQYYVQNGPVQAGLSWNGLLWAFRTGWASNWHPLTWLSLMVDADMGTGPNDAWTPHFTNIVLHALNAALLFVLLLRATAACQAAPTPPSGTKWRCLLVAGLFALHPLNVESVAWVAERKNVLSMFFFLLSLLAYVRFGQVLKTAGASPDGATKARTFFWTSLGVYALSLMSKPMVVTLPFVLLLLDVWPLGRVPVSLEPPAGTRAVWKQLVLEKWAFFLLSVAACVVTYLVQQHGDAVQSAAHFPLAGRIENVWVSYARYLAKAFWPVGLAIYYPHPGHWPALQWSLSAALVLLVSVAALQSRRNHPCVLVGWFWFLGTLVPVLGLVQAGTQSMADRYAYLPLIGLFIAIVWSAAEILARLHPPRLTGWLAGGVLLLTLAAVTRHQLLFWQNDGTLFSHALAVTPENPVAEVTLGTYLDGQHQPEEAAKHYRAALAIDPNDRSAHFDLGIYLEDKGQPEAAIGEYRAAIRSNAKCYPAMYNLGLLLERLGRRDEAVAEYQAALRVQPDFVDAKQHLQALGVAAP